MKHIWGSAIIIKPFYYSFLLVFQCALHSLQKLQLFITRIWNRILFNNLGYFVVLSLNFSKIERIICSWYDSPQFQSCPNSSKALIFSKSWQFFKVIYDILLIFAIFIDVRRYLYFSINEKEYLFDFLTLRF